MARNPNINIKPVTPDYDGGQHANGEVEGAYYNESMNINGWVPTGGPASASPGDDPGRFRSKFASGDFDGKSYGVELPINKDAGQYEGQNVERITVDVSLANRGRES
jgi:hypothetical protein